MITRLNPDTLYHAPDYGFSHATLQDGGRTLHLAGQVAWDKDCNLVGAGDYVAQTRQVLANISEILKAQGCTPADVARIRIYVVDHTREKLRPILAVIKEFYGEAAPAPSTYIGVHALALPEFLVEVEATAVVPSARF